jgi:sporulation protein YlmC with PRC-barrel domain
MARDEEEREMSMSTSSPRDPDEKRDTEDHWEEEEDHHQYRRVMAAGILSGDRVRNSAGEHLGKIEDIMIDIPTGRVAYAVLCFGGVLGMGNKLFAVPWQALILNEREHEFVLDVDKEKLQSAPGFDKNNWPDMADPTWAEQMHGHWGEGTDWTESAIRHTDEIDRRQREGVFDRDLNRHL